MARRKKMLERRKLLSPRALLGEEPRASVAVTVAWMLTLFISGVALVIALVCLLVAQRAALSQEGLRNIKLLGNLMILSAAMTGLLCLVLTVAVYRVRRDPPPIAITVVAVILSVLPLVLLLLLI